MLSRSRATRRRAVSGPALALAVLAFGAATLATGAYGVRTQAGSAASPPSATTATSATPTTPAAPAPVSARAPGKASALDQAREHTREVPQDAAGWAALAFTALEAGRASGEPALYAEAQAAEEHSLAIHPQDNDLALAARAALSDAKHNFAAALPDARRALAINPDSAVGLAALTDGLTELGRTDEALVAARRLDAVRPGVTSFTRLSYQAELRGQVPQARELMVRAAQDAGTPAQIAFARAHEGLLALSVGDLPGARVAWRAGVAAAPDDVDLLHLQARIAVNAGDLRGAAKLYAALVARRPSPANASEQADVLQALGDGAGARTAVIVAQAGFALSARSGVGAEGIQVLFQAEHATGRAAAAAAVPLGQEVWRRAPTTGNADALAWALHLVGQDRAALPYAERALALGSHQSGFLYHRGAILAALGRRAPAIADLRAALARRAFFSPLEAPAAQRLLAPLVARS